MVLIKRVEKPHHQRNQLMLKRLKMRLLWRSQSMWRRWGRQLRLRSQFYDSVLFKSETGLYNACKSIDSQQSTCTKSLMTGFKLLKRQKWIQLKKCVQLSNVPSKTSKRFSTNSASSLWISQLIILLLIMSIHPFRNSRRLKSGEMIDYVFHSYSAWSKNSK